jgi:hypothetical protein
MRRCVLMGATVTTAGIALFSMALQPATAQARLVQPAVAPGNARVATGHPTGAPPKVTTTSLAPAELDAPYSQTISFSCGDAPCTTTLTGKLPPGLSFNATTSTISGVPSATGPYPITFTVTDAAGRRASRSYTNFAVFTGPILTSPIPAGEVGAAYDAPLVISGGVPPYGVTVTAGSLPPGLALVGGGSTGGASEAIAGTPVAAGGFNFTLTITAGHGLANQFAESVSISPQPVITTGVLSGGQTGIPYSQGLVVSGGTSPFTWSVAGGALPIGLSLSPATGSITGTPDLAGSSNLVIEVTDAFGQIAPHDYTLSVALWKPPLVPSGSLLGASVYYDHSEPKAGQINVLEADIGRTLDIDNNYFKFADNLVGSTAMADEQAGRIPLDSWACADPATIVSGKLDSKILAQAAEVKSYAYPIYLRWSWEMDQGANATCANKEGPAEFVLAWRHIWTLFQQAGATNAAWVWCPSHLAFSNNSYESYYPGDEYVDYACADGYSRSTSAPTSFADLFTPLYNAFSTPNAVTNGKPILIGETGEEPGATQAAWISQVGQQVSSDFPDIKALLFFDSRGKDDYAITAPASVTALANLARSTYFNPLDRPLSPEQHIPMPDCGAQGCPAIPGH